MPDLVVAPDPITPATVANIEGTGFANRKTRLLLDGVGSTTNVFRPRADGSFRVGITVASTPRTQTLVAQQQDGSKWPEVARTSIAVAVPVPPPVVVPPPPATPTYYASPTGSDSTGDGSQQRPWRTPIPFITACRAGDTLVIGGQYPAGVSGLTITRRHGTADKPISILGGEFLGRAQFWLNIVDSSYLYVQPAALLNWSQPDTGVITTTQGSHHLAIRSRIRLAPNLGSNQHGVYIGPGVHDVLVQGEIDGNGGSGCGVQVYSGSSEQPYGVTVRDCTIGGFSGTGNAHGRGVNFDTSSPNPAGVVEGVTFTDNKVHVRAQRGRDIAVRNCRGTKAAVANISREVAATPGFVESGNVWAA